MSVGFADRGREWQGIVETMHIRYVREGRIPCWIRNEPVRTASRSEDYGDAVERVTAGRGAPDYTVVTNEAVLLVEVKDWTSSPKFPWRMLYPYQAARLEAGERSPICRGFVLLRLQGAPYLLPWRDISEAWHRNRPSTFDGSWGHLQSEDYLGAALRCFSPAGFPPAADPPFPPTGFR
jgi:hypothetical protein